jgi:hypothetical protein
MAQRCLPHASRHYPPLQILPQQAGAPRPAMSHRLQADCFGSGVRDSVNGAGVGNELLALETTIGDKATV